MPHTPLQLILYTAPGCCLCEELRAQLAGLAGEFSFTLQEVDISGDPDLEERYRAEIPVLLINGRKAAKLRISTEALRGRLRRASGFRLLHLLRLR